MDRDKLRSIVRPALVLVTVVTTGLFLGTRAAGTAVGTALVLAVVWLVIKGKRPTWASGWSGAWLFIMGVVIVFMQGVYSAMGTFESNISIAAGIGVATLLVLPAMVVSKAWSFAKSKRSAPA